MPASTSECGRGITCRAENFADSTSGRGRPRRPAAFHCPNFAAHYRGYQSASIFSQPTSVTFADFTAASAASIIATRPRHSIIPSASCILPSHLETRLYTALKSVPRPATKTELDIGSGFAVGMNRFRQSLSVRGYPTLDRDLNSIMTLPARV